MNKTKIEWTDYTWNPVTGCLHGCEYCYARKISMRFNGHFEPEFHEDRLEQPYKAKKPSKIFVSSMGDLLGEWVKPEWIERVIITAKYNPRHTFQFLTKNPKRYREFDWPYNCWLGATATNQKEYDKAATVFVDGDFENTFFISCEPLLGKIKMRIVWLDWLIIGSQTNPDKQPEKEWVKMLLDKAKADRTFVFCKNNLDYPDKPQEFPK